MWNHTNSGEECRFRPNRDVIDTVLGDDEATLMFLDAKLTYALNRTGLRIWRLLKEGRTVGQIVEGLYEEFDVEREQAKENTLNFIEELLAHKLIVAVNRE